MSLGAAPGAFAASEQGDAGDLRATSQDLGAGPVAAISGTFLHAADADLYRVCLSDGTSFSASTVADTTPNNLDTQLFLFDSNGHGVYANDDAVGTRNSRLPAGHLFSPSRGGEYFLAVSPYNHDPQSSQGEIFMDDYSRWSYPDGVLDANGFGSAGSLASWNGRWPGGPGSYRITVTGTVSCVPPDTTPPTIDLRSPVKDARVPRNAEIVVDFSCADEGGSGLLSCVGTTPDGGQLDTSALGDVSVTVTARDNAGNQTVLTHTVTVVDETAPTISLDSPANGAVYTLGQRVLADYACADEPGGSGVAACEGTVANGAAINTSSIGTHSFQVRTSDNAGNTDTRTVSYSVFYPFEGFGWPVENLPRSNRWKAGLPVPIRFSLDGYRGANPEAVGYPRSTRCDGADIEPAARSSSKNRPVFRYERRSDRYVMGWKTDRRWAGSCRDFVLQLDDGSVHTARFQFTKR